MTAAWFLEGTGLVSGGERKNRSLRSPSSLYHLLGSRNLLFHFHGVTQGWFDFSGSERIRSLGFVDPDFFGEWLHHRNANHKHFRIGLIRPDYDPPPFLQNLILPIQANHRRGSLSATLILRVDATGGTRGQLSQDSQASSKLSN